MPRPLISFTETEVETVLDLLNNSILLLDRSEVGDAKTAKDTVQDAIDAIEVVTDECK